MTRKRKQYLPDFHILVTVPMVVRIVGQFYKLLQRIPRLAQQGAEGNDGPR